MLIIEYLPEADVECEKPATYVLKDDPEHTICQACFDAMADEPDIQAEYEPLLK